MAKKADKIEYEWARQRNAEGAGAFDGSPNENSNGNALARVCEAYLA